MKEDGGTIGGALKSDSEGQTSNASPTPLLASASANKLLSRAACGGILRLVVSEESPR